MSNFRTEFLEYALQCGVLKFGEFKLKSGRISPYFFNTGLFDTGEQLRILGEYYARAIIEAGLEFDMLFGPAYKGIPLVSTVAIAFSAVHDRDVPWAFDRKEAKSHGEGGTLVGASLKGRVLIVDDVISAGTSSRHARGLILHEDAEIAGMALALDRQERGQGESSAAAEVQDLLGAPVISISDLDHLLVFVAERPDLAESLSQVKRYRAQYGA